MYSAFMYVCLYTCSRLPRRVGPARDDSIRCVGDSCAKMDVAFVYGVAWHVCGVGVPWRGVAYGVAWRMKVCEQQDVACSNDLGDVFGLEFNTPHEMRNKYE